ncbi:MobA/MobL family protein [Megasphaera elsdenii]|uniref:MobA/MobL family protein n=1 Tax=Megasphaera elsdenii TaxID=907 RepID=UPI00242C4DA0|nr:MobA/MobL family protein [Megasphaera elsdenii]
MAHFHLSMKVQPRQKDGRKLSAKLHYDYIARQDKYAHLKGRQEDFVLAESGNLPAWAHGNAGTFWKEAEDHRSPSGTAYREIEIGLQEELSLEDNMALLKGFMNEFHIDNYAYTFALHSKDSSLEQGHTNIHAHLMFCEKIQEADRPLGPDKFFQRYRETASGEKTGGYLSSREFKSKSVLRTMRKRWAERVNEMFRERGIDAEITEKNNADRYDELVEQGRYDEAELVNRTAAPHLGRAYRNDAIMEKLRDMEDEEMKRDNLALNDVDPDTSDEAEQAETEERVKAFAEKSKQEQMLMLFVNDLQIRRLARVIQMERLKQKEAEEVRKTEGKEISNPLIITAGDLDLRMRDEELRLQQIVDDARETYRQARCEAWEEKPLQDEAIARVLGEDWRKEKQRLLGLQGTLKAIGKHLYDKRTPEEEKAYRKRNSRVRTAYNDCRKKMAQWDTRKAEKQGEIDTLYASLKAANDTHRKASNWAYGDLKRKEKQLQAFQNKRVLLATNYKSDDILFAEKLARKVQPYCKVLGRQSLKDLVHGPYQGKEYYLTGEIRFDPKKREWTGLAIRVGDDMDQGKAPLYKVRLHEEGPDQDVTIFEVKPTKERIAMYKELHQDQPRCQSGKFRAKAHNSQGLEKPCKGASQTPPRPIAKAAVQKLNDLMDEAMKSETGRIAIHWQDDQRRYAKKTKMEKTEEELYKGWAL